MVLSIAFTPAFAQTTVEYIHTDALGSPVAVTDASGNVIEREVYEPYGSPITRAPSDQPGFTGHVADSLTGLTYMQQRYYDPQIGKFLSVDPVTAYSNPVGAFNRYWYANNNPYRFTDPDGRQTINEEARRAANFVANTAKGIQSDVNTLVSTPGNEPLPMGPLLRTATLPLAFTGGTVTRGATASIEAGSAGVASTLATNAARTAASVARKAGATRGAATGAVTRSGQIFTGLSERAGGPGIATNPVVQKVVDSISPALRSCFRGGCGEINAASNALNAGAKLEGSTMTTINLRTGEVMAPCPTCAQVADRLGINTIPN